MDEIEYICPNCGEKENLHFNYDNFIRILKLNKE